MSNLYYNELWLITRNDLHTLLELDKSLQRSKAPKLSETGLNKLLPVYLRYRNLVKRLIVCHDQMVQAQKRNLIKQVLDCAVGRMLEYKREIVNLNYSEYHWPDDIMNQFKYTPDDVEIAVSATGKDIVQQRREKIHQLIAEAHAVAEEASKESSIGETSMIHNDSEASVDRRTRRRVGKPESSMKQTPVFLEASPSQMAVKEARETAEREMRNAILLVQSHERARIGRSIGTEVQRMYTYNKKLEVGEIVPKKLHRSMYIEAARIIQRAWKRYVEKKKLRKRIDRVEELLDMTIPSWKPREVFQKDRENFQKKLTLMPAFATRVADMTEKERARLLKVRGPGLMEDITEEIRQWFVLWYDELGFFNVYPAAELGGSVLIATGETLTPQEYVVQKVSKGDEKEQTAKSKTKKRKKKPLIPETPLFACLKEANQDFITNWIFRNDHSNYHDSIYEDLIKDKLCYQLQLEMREIVDELMRLELKKLNAALKKDYKADKKTLELPKEKRRRKRGAKKKKDRFGDVSVEDHFKELASADIIRNYPTTSLQDWIGDLSYQNYEADRELRDHRYRMGEIKQAIMEYCVLPMSSKEIHQAAPLVRSVCICGLPRYGKSFLVNAICSELGAVLFDMSPPVLVNKYRGKRNEKKLVRMIERVAREFAPSVIFVDNGEKPWLKKVPPEEKNLNPKRFARQFPKMVKRIKRGTQILFLTTSSEPYKATRRFVRVHNKFIMIPLTDYNTLYMFYKDLLMKYHGVDRNIDVSSIAKMTVGIPLEFIKNAVDNVLNVQRRITLRFNPLSEQEIIEEVLKYEPLPTKTLAQMAKFESQTPLAKKRTKYLILRKTGKKV